MRRHVDYHSIAITKKGNLVGYGLKSITVEAAKIAAVTITRREKHLYILHVRYVDSTEETIKASNVSLIVGIDSWLPYRLTLTDNASTS